MRLLSVILALAVTVGAAANTIAADVNDFLDFSNTQVPGRLFVPPEAGDPADPRPLILFLHGAGETGSNNLAQINGNIDNLLDGAKQQGAFLYAPQATTFTWADAARTANVMSMIDEALANFNVDPSRLYVTGLSMGGGGVWNMINRFPDRFAAATPIAAVSPGSDFNPANLVGKPTWAFHARNDGTVPSTASRNVVNRILSAANAAPLTYPATNDGFATLRYSNDAVGLEFSEFSIGGHGIWGPVYDTPELYDWMFSHTLTTPAPVEPAGGGQVLVNNFGPFFPIGDTDGISFRAGVGFVAVGAIELDDALVSQTNAASLAALANAFHQFGASVPIGVNGLEGLINANIGAPLSADDLLLGKNVYLVVGDGSDIGSSESLIVFKSDAKFALDAPSFMTTISLSSALDGASATGKLLLGRLGTVFANRLGGNRPGIIAAAVNIPEPTSALLLAFAGGVFATSTRRRR